MTISLFDQNDPAPACASQASTCRFIRRKYGRSAVRLKHMARICSVAVAIFLLLGAATEARPQGALADQFHVAAADREAANRPLTESKQPVILTSPVKRQWAPLVQIETILPSISFAGSPKTQIHYVGGALQSYLNVNSGDLTGRMYDIVAPFGATAVVPVVRGRAEVYGGAAGVFVPFASPYSRQNSWLTQASIGFRLRLDPGYHFWLGTTAHYLTDFADKKRQWAYGTADLTIRFGN
jgi:hypothetical protein